MLDGVQAGAGAAARRPGVHPPGDALAAHRRARADGRADPGVSQDRQNAGPPRGCAPALGGRPLGSVMDATERARHHEWLLELTQIPTAAGHEQRVIRWLRAWV